MTSMQLNKFVYMHMLKCTTHLHIYICMHRVAYMQISHERGHCAVRVQTFNLMAKIGHHYPTMEALLRRCTVGKSEISVENCIFLESSSIYIRSGLGWLVL